MSHSTINYKFRAGIFFIFSFASFPPFVRGVFNFIYTHTRFIVVVANVYKNFSLTPLELFSLLKENLLLFRI